MVRGRHHARCAVLHRAKHAESARSYARSCSCTTNTKLEWNTRNSESTANARCTPRVLIEAEDGPHEDLAPLSLTPLLDAGPKPKPKVTKIKVSKRQQASNGKRTTSTLRNDRVMRIRSTCDEEKAQELQLLQSQTDQIVIKRPMRAAIFKLGRSGALERGTQVRRVTVEPENETLTQTTLGAPLNLPAAH